MISTPVRFQAIRGAIRAYATVIFKIYIFYFYYATINMPNSIVSLLLNYIPNDLFRLWIPILTFFI